MTEEAKKESTEHINLKVLGQDGQVVHFKIKQHTSLKKLMSAYCARSKLAQSTVRFRFDGQAISENDTPRGLDMEDGDTIEVFQQQTGGQLMSGDQQRIVGLNPQLFSEAKQQREKVPVCHNKSSFNQRKTYRSHTSSHTNDADVFPIHKPFNKHISHHLAFANSAEPGRGYPVISVEAPPPPLPRNWRVSLIS